MSNPYNNIPSGISQDGGYSSFLPRNRGSHAAASGASAATLPSSHPSLSRLSSILNQTPDTNPELYTTHHSYIRTGSGVIEGDRNAAASDGTASGLRQQNAQLPLFSRAFEMFMNPVGDSVWASRHRNNGLVVPSYLANTAYIHKLEEAHRSKQAQRDNQPSTVGSNALPASQASVPSVAANPTSHLGMTYDLIERAPAFEDDDTIAPLPTRWNKDDKNGGLEVMAEGQEVKYTAQKGVGERDYEASAIRADHALPHQVGIYYYEITLLSRKRDEYVAAVCHECLIRSTNGVV